jgi:hypothetical protein
MRRLDLGQRRGAFAGVAIFVLLAVALPAQAVQVEARRSTTDTHGVTKTKTVTRSYLNPDGTTTQVDKRTVTLSVSQNTELRGRQEITVSWKGARPTAGTRTDPSSSTAALAEYPMVLMECRGLDSTSVPVAQRLSPQTCWTRTSEERFSATPGEAFPPWRIDGYAAASDRAAFPDRPKEIAAACVDDDPVNEGVPAEHWLPFKAASGTTFFGGNTGACDGMPPEAYEVDAPGSLPDETQWATTGVDGTGTTQFDVWSDDENASLGCSATVRCSLVAIPIMGVSCDADDSSVPAKDRPAGDDLSAALASCETTGAYAPGQPASPNQGPDDLAVNGYLWWSASNWRGRISIPLTFAPSTNVCAVTGKHTAVNVYGSEALAEATQQWAPTFCLNPKLFTFSHVQTSEPEAKELVATGGINAAFASTPPDGGFSTPVVQAPVAVTGFAISYTIDDAKGHPITHLKLDARLLAKLLTESYPSSPDVSTQYKALQGVRTKSGVQLTPNNPENISKDPEFQALNPEVGIRNSLGTAAEMIMLNSTSDVVEALTSYINADPEARAWLDGQPDPWGMHVNPNYRDIELPVNSWPVLDQFEVKNPANDCLTSQPVPYLPLVAAPTSSLFNSALDVQFAIANSRTVCNQPLPPTSQGESLTTTGTQAPGGRFIIGITSLAQAERYGLNTAELETSATVPYSAFSDATGRTFVGPTNAGLKAAVAELQAGKTDTSWTLPYATLGATTAGQGAYPGTMVVYADVRTSGVPKEQATDLATLMRFMATTGQKSGLNNGELPPGYLPLTPGDGLGALQAYTLHAADDVEAQNGFVPDVFGPWAAPASSPSPSASTGGGATVPPPVVTPTPTPTSSPTTSTSSSPKPSTTPKPTPSASPSSIPTASPDIVLTADTRSHFGAVALPALLILGLLGGLISAAVRLWPRRRLKP